MVEEEGELLHQLFPMLSLVSCFIGVDSRHSYTFPNCEEEFGPGNNDNNEWVKKDEEDIDLEEDTNIEEGEVDDLK